MEKMEQKYNRNGGLTLVPLSGFVDLAQNIASHIASNHSDTPVDIVIPEFGTRASGEPFVKLGKDHVGGHDCVVLTSGPGTPKMLLELWLTLGYLVGRRAARITIVTGYLPFARSDKDEGALEFALASHIIHLTTNAGYGTIDRIIAADLHAPQVVMSAPLGRITEVSLARMLLFKVVEDALNFAPGEKLCLLLPDDGAYKKFTKVIKEVSDLLKTELPVVCGQKRRENSRSSHLFGLSGNLEALKDALVIGFDDEIATGGTNFDTAQYVKTEYGAKNYWAAAIHGVLCGEGPQKIASPDSPISRIYITDTIPPHNRPELEPLRKNNKLYIVSWAKDLAHIIYFHHWDRSIREMR